MQPPLRAPAPADGGSLPIVARDVWKTYASGRLRVPALRGVSLSIAAGEIVAIVGPSGCGKTTLLHCLSGLETIDRGEILLEGRNLANLSDARKAEHRARRVGFVFQSYNLLPVLNALENVELPLLLAGHSVAEARRRALRALEVVGLENRLRHRPSELSGGQQQRVAVARALAPEPAVIFADEPTGNLDSDSAEEVMQLIARLNHDNHQTFVLVTHAREVAARAGRIIRMRDGEIIVQEQPGPVSGQPNSTAAHAGDAPPRATAAPDGPPEAPAPRWPSGSPPPPQSHA